MSEGGGRERERRGKSDSIKDGKEAHWTDWLTSGGAEEGKKDTVDLWRRVPMCVCMSKFVHFEYSYAVESGSWSTRFDDLNGSPVWPPVLLGRTHTSVHTKIRPSLSISVFSSLPFIPLPRPTSSFFYFLHLARSRWCFPADKNTFEKPKALRIIITWVFFFFFLCVCYLCICWSCQLPKESRHTICYDLCTPAFSERPPPPCHNLKRFRGSLARASTVTPFDPVSSVSVYSARPWL